MKSKPVFIGKKWTLEVEPRTGAIKGVAGFITEAHSAATVKILFQPNGYDVGPRYLEVRNSFYVLPSYLIRRIRGMMNVAAKSLR